MALCFGCAWLKQAFCSALRRVRVCARKLHASVHTPRISDSSTFDWYGAERLLKKHLLARGVRTVAYFIRRHESMYVLAMELGVNSDGLAAQV